jgi:hypothetical protein
MAASTAFAHALIPKELTATATRNEMCQVPTYDAFKSYCTRFRRQKHRMTDWDAFHSVFKKHVTARHEKAAEETRNVRLARWWGMYRTGACCPKIR